MVQPRDGTQITKSLMNRVAAQMAAGKPIYLIADPAELPRAHDALADYHLAIVWPQCQQFDTNILGTYQWCPLTRKT
jgi:hypothetical protein